MARPRKIPLEEALRTLNKDTELPLELQPGPKVVEWLIQVGFPKKHAIPKGRGISLCGRGGDRPWHQDPSNLPKCKKCLFLVKYKDFKEKA
jgi:hypothetical protein